MEYDICGIYMKNVIMVQQNDAVFIVFVAKPDDQSSVPESHMPEGKK